MSSKNFCSDILKIVLRSLFRGHYIYDSNCGPLTPSLSNNFSYNCQLNGVINCMIIIQNLRETDYCSGVYSNILLITFTHRPICTYMCDDCDYDYETSTGVPYK